MRTKNDGLKRLSEVVSDNPIKLLEGEKMWVSYFNQKGERKYILTGTYLRDKYSLYLVNENGRLKKLGECASPMKLEEKFDILENLKKT